MKKEMTPAVSGAVIAVVALLAILAIWFFVFRTPGASRTPAEAGPIPSPAAPPPPPPGGFGG